MLIDYHIHALGHRGGPYNRELLEQFFSNACKRHLSEIGLTDHDDYYEGVLEDIVRETAAVFPRLNVKLGLEVSYWPGREREIISMKKQKSFDFFIGSIHHINSWMFDHPDYRDEYQNWNLHDLYKTYFHLVEELVRSGIFEIVGHLDLIKVFGYQYPGDLLNLVDPVLQAVKEQGMAVELNTSGLYKPCREIYPSQKIIKRCYDLNIPFTLGSDAHEANDVGRNLEEAKKLLYQVGYRKITTFYKCRQKLVNL